MKTPTYIAFDTELGGGSAENSLLTAYFAILDQDLDIIDHLYLYCKPDDGIYKVTGQGMKVNGIDIVRHDSIAKSYKVCGKELYQFLSKYKIKGQYLKALGQSIAGDVRRVTNDLISEESWYQFVSYRTLDIGIIAGFAIDLKLLPDDLSAGLAAMAEYFNVGIQNDVGHDAREDVLLTVGVYKKLKNVFKNKMI